MPMIKMVHKSWKPSENREPALVEESVFENVWKEKGWQRAPEDGGSAPSPAPQEVSVSESSEEESSGS